MAQAVQDFSLPPNPAPSATPRVQGPVDEESGPVPIRPRVIATATPAPTPTPTSAPAPRPEQTIPVDGRVFAPAPAASRAPGRTDTARGAPVRASSGAAPAATPVTDDAPVAVPLPDTQTPAASPTSPPAAPLPTVSPPATAPSPEQGAALPFDWRWLAGLGGALVLALGGWLALRRRTGAPPPVVERPVVSGAAPRAEVPMAEALAIRCEAEKLTRSAVYATLKYRLALVNRTDGALSNVAIGLDLVSAHAGAPMEQQVATPGTALDTRHTLARIAPRQTLTVEGQVQLPLAGAQVIRQGRHPLLVPLLRVRVDGSGEGALVKTFVIGQGLPDGGRVQPFRLDEPPRSYAPLAHRELA